MNISNAKELICSPNHLEDWFHESKVCLAVVRHLTRTGYTIQKDTSARFRDKGADIIATSPEGKKVIIEVKGFPSVNHTKGATKGTKKRTKPEQQCVHWFQEVIMTVISRYSVHASEGASELAIALPNVDRYHKLMERYSTFFTDFGINIQVLFSDSVGNIQVTNLNKNAQFGSNNWRGD